MLTFVVGANFIVLNESAFLGDFCVGAPGVVVERHASVHLRQRLKELGC